MITELNITVPLIDGRLDYINLFNVPGLHGYSVYSIEHNESGRPYFNTAKNVEGRFKRYERHVRRKYYESFMTSVLIDFGIENFSFKVIASGFPLQSDAKEYTQRLLDALPQIEVNGRLVPDAFNRTKTSAEVA